MSVHDIASWLADTSIAVSLLIVAVLAVRGPVAKHLNAEAAYLLWLAPLARLFMPEFAILPASWRAAALPESESAIASIEVNYGPAANAPAAASPDWILIVLAAWAIGAVVFLALQWSAQRRFLGALYKSGGAPTAEIAAEAALIAERSGLSATPRLIIAADNTGPMVAGFLQPVVVLPANFACSYTSVERQLALAHEYSHIKRGDLAMTFAALLFRAAQWPNPLAHFAFRAFRADQEAACDASVLARNAAFPDISYAYGAAIVKAAANRFAAPAASLPMSNHLKVRLMLMKTGNKMGAGAGRAIAASLIAIAIAASASYSYAAEKEVKAEKTEPVKKHRSVSVSVYSVNSGEELKIAGVNDAKKIEIRNVNGERTVRVWNWNGVLVSENRYGPGEKMPFEEITMIDKKGQANTIDISRPPEHPMAPTPPEWSMSEGDGEHQQHKVIVINKGDGETVDFVGHCSPDDGDARAMTFSDEDESDDGDHRITREIICLDGDESASPAKRAEALRKVIDRMEADSEREAAQRAKMISTLKAELAKAEKDAAKK